MGHVEPATLRVHRTIHYRLAVQPVDDRYGVETGADRRTDCALKCRLYRTPDGFAGTPPDAWVLDALRRPGRA
jgi:hypothetical protein